MIGEDGAIPAVADLPMEEVSAYVGRRVLVSAVYEPWPRADEHAVRSFEGVVTGVVGDKVALRIGRAANSYLRFLRVDSLLSIEDVPAS